MKKKKIKRAIKEAIAESYGKAGFTTVANKMLTIFNTKLDNLYKK